jgi:hypothetical protein
MQHVRQAIALARSTALASEVAHSLSRAFKDPSLRAIYTNCSPQDGERLYENLVTERAVSCTMFHLGCNADIPLHDHPGFVATLVLEGELECVTLAASSPRAQRQRAECLSHVTVGPGNVLLCNGLHAIRATGRRAVSMLDIVWPPYADANACAYYSWMPDGSKQHSDIWSAEKGSSGHIIRLDGDPPGWFVNEVPRAKVCNALLR